MTNALLQRLDNGIGCLIVGNQRDLTRRRLGNGLCDTAHKESCKPAATMGSHDNQVDFAQRCKTPNFVDYVATDKMLLIIYRVGTWFGFRKEAFLVIQGFHVPRSPWWARMDGILHMQDVQLGVILRRHATGVFQCSLATIGKIDWAEYSFGLHVLDPLGG